MRHHTDSGEFIYDASLLEPSEQRLFLVRDVNNQFDSNAVMLHNGARKLGYVSAQQAPKIRKVIDELSLIEGKDQVLVLNLAKQESPSATIWATSLDMKVVGYVYERIARKLATEK